MQPEVSFYRRGSLVSRPVSHRDACENHDSPRRPGAQVARTTPEYCTSEPAFGVGVLPIVSPCASTGSIAYS